MATEPTIAPGLGVELGHGRHRSVSEVAALVVQLLEGLRTGDGPAFSRVRAFRLSAAERLPVEIEGLLGPEGPPRRRTATFHGAASGALGFSVDLPHDDGLVVVGETRAIVSVASMRALELLALRCKRALLDTDEIRDRVGDRERAHVEVLERMLRVYEAYRDAESEESSQQLVGQNERMRRTQRAILNVIDDLREVKAGLEARVEERTARIREILEETQDSFFALDRDLHFTLMNRRHESTLGVSRDESLGRRFFEVFPVPETSKLWTELHRVRDLREPASFVEHHATRDLWLEVSATPASDGGVTVFYRDITARVRLEKERERLLANEHRARIEAEAARAQAESASRMKDEFLSTVSHELRTPLTSMLGWTQLLRSGRIGADRLPVALETIERNARAQVRLIEDLLDLGRILQGKFKLAVGPVEVVRVVEAALESLRPAAEAKGVRLQRTLDSHATIVGDGERIQQVVWNLVSNAIKFTPKGGRVHVTLRRAASYVELAVADSGEGIGAEFLPHVFEPFRQADGAITRRTGGLGLGLSIVRSLVELHGGTVSAASDGPGLGSTFAVRIPIAPVRAQPEQPGQASAFAPPTFDRPAELDGARVLVVDDEPDTRQLVAFVLEQCNAVVTQAGSSDEAVCLLDVQTFDVLVSDVGMPGEDGLSMIRRIRARPEARGGRVPAVALTAYARSEDRAEAIRSGFDAHLAKPVDASELALVVAALVRSRR